MQPRWMLVLLRTYWGVGTTVSLPWPLFLRAVPAPHTCPSVSCPLWELTGGPASPPCHRPGLAFLSPGTSVLGQVRQVRPSCGPWLQRKLRGPAISSFWAGGLSGQHGVGDAEAEMEEKRWELCSRREEFCGLGRKLGHLFVSKPPQS